jgi:hypothetical protein
MSSSGTELPDGIASPGCRGQFAKGADAVVSAIDVTDSVQLDRGLSAPTLTFRRTGIALDLNP